jgi:hypothetical protein
MILAEHNNDLLIFESTTGCDEECVITKKKQNGTQAHYIDSRLQSYRGKVWHYPLLRPLRTGERKKLSSYLVSSLGIPYDTRGASQSGGKLWSLIESRLHKESLSSLFCSEWVAAGLREIERFDTINASAWSPNSLIRECNERGMLRQCRRIK